MFLEFCSRSLLWIATITGLAGCRMYAPIHVWQTPEIESTVGKRVVVSEIEGAEDISDQLSEKLIAMAPNDTGREVSVVRASELEKESDVQLASASQGATSDIALASYASEQGYDYVLRGELLKDRGRRALEIKNRMAVSWRLFSLTENRPVGGKPVIVELDAVLKKHPELSLAGSDEDILQAAMVRETFNLLTQSIKRDEIQLAIPYLLPGSKQVRKANILAMKGRWFEAKEIWQTVAEKQPLQVAAMHNLALAFAAEQDFSSAKHYARKAIRARPTQLNKQSLMWIEIQQRQYHNAFNLPDPPEGWFVTK